MFYVKDGSTEDCRWIKISDSGSGYFFNVDTSTGIDITTGHRRITIYQGNHGSITEDQKIIKGSYVFSLVYKN